ncbi:MAG: imidazole glycerol phosphate synthase subunit HisH [Ferruginibacter sp.]
MKIAIIKYNAGNVQSIQYALQRLGYEAVLTDKEEVLQAANKIIFPGVGHAGAAMKSLQASGLDQVIPALTQPLLGICVGMQLLCNYSEEGDTTCLGLVDTVVKKFSPSGHLKVPQVGWNTIYDLDAPLFKGLPAENYVYYVHSYYAALSGETIAKTDYGLPYAAAVQKNNFYGVQFHTEKSAAVGDRILSNFLSL